MVHSVNRFTAGKALGRFPQKAKSSLFAPRARTKRKKRARRLAADDPAPSFCLQNDGLEFPNAPTTAHLRQQTAQSRIASNILTPPRVLHPKLHKLSPSPTAEPAVFRRFGGFFVQNGHGFRGGRSRGRGRIAWSIPKERGVFMEKKETACQCLDDLPLAMAYVPMQKWGDQYAPAVGLERGTIFPQLDLPFIGEEAVPNGQK